MTHVAGAAGRVARGRRALGHGLALYGRLVAADVRGQMQYRASFVSETIGMFLATAVDFAAILVYFSRFETIGGWTLPEVALLYGLVNTSFGIAHLVAQGFDDLHELVRMGGFDRLLVRPAPTYLQVLGAQLPLRQLGRLAQALLVLSLALAWLDAAAWGPARWAFMVWTILGGALFFLGLLTLSGAICFWTVESVEAVNILTYGGSEMAGYPMHIFGGWLRRVFVYLVPLAFVNYVPALYLLGRDDPLGLPSYAPFLAFPLCALVLLVARRIWRVGVRRYTSVGH